MNTLESVKQRLEYQFEQTSVAVAKTWLERHRVEPVAEAPAKITVAEALRLWRTRLAVSTQNKHPVEGLSGLVETLKGMTGQKRVDQYGFLGDKSAASFLFEHSSGSYIGAALVEKIPSKRHDRLFID